MNFLSLTVKRTTKQNAPAKTVKRFYRLEKRFINNYDKKSPPFGFNGLGEFVYLRTYSRNIESSSTGVNRKETWKETVERVVNGCFSLQERYLNINLSSCVETQREAEEMYDRIFHMKFLPPGRGLWAMGTAITEKRELYAALNNCAFVSTEEIDKNLAEPFSFLMDATMLGVGVGFDTKGARKRKIYRPNEDNQLFSIPDTREGWVQSLEILMESFAAPGRKKVDFDYSLIRPAGLEIKGFGGTSSGPGPLEELHQSVSGILSSYEGKALSSTGIVDIMNLIGKCVVSGNVRRTAEIAFGEPKDQDFQKLKDYKLNPHRASFGWTSNNSVLAEIAMDYSGIVDGIYENGEPGLAWLENMRKYSRMSDAADWKDEKAKGGNPCLEQTLESFELCCLVETFPAKHKSKADFKKTLRSALLYAKTVTLGDVHWEKTREVMNRNRRIGCSMSGIQQFIAQHDLGTLKEWSNEGYKTLRQVDMEFSSKFGVTESIKLTSIKPSGTVSLLAGATPGLHFPESRFYIRRVRVKNEDPMLQSLIDAGLNVEDDVIDPTGKVVEFVVDAGKSVRTLNEVSLEEQLDIAAFLQSNWADNQVSCTATFDPSQVSKGQFTELLNEYQYKLKGISFLPKVDFGAFAQMPYEEITEQEYIETKAKMRPLSFEQIYLGNNEVPDKEQDRYCDGDLCVA
eukprot:snap_masked-scaffold_2-processed-gene-12.55-mRNA-1 protein AED:0.01 eAED:0.01 QI:0/-1/0/1/-1/1/1/0/683